MNIHEAIESYKTYLVIEKRLTENSIEAYISDIRQLSTYCASQGITTPECVTGDVILGFLKYQKEGGIATRTQNRSISSIRSFFKFLVLDGQLKDNPSRLLESPRIERKIPNILSAEEVNSILNAVEMYKPEGQRNKAIIKTLYTCGLRVSEVISLKLEDVNFRSGEIQVSGKEGKKRLVPLTHEAKQEIKLYMKGFREYLDIVPGFEDVLFLNKRGTALSRVMIFNIIKHLADRAGIKKHISPHTLRHSFAYELVSNGTDLIAVQNILGHESVLTTEIYAHMED